MRLETVLLIKLFNVGLAVVCTFMVLLVALAQGNKRKLKAVYFLNASRFKLAWRILFLASVLLVLDEMGVPVAFGEAATSLYQTLELAVFLTALTILYSALKVGGGAETRFLTRQKLGAKRTWTPPSRAKGKTRAGALAGAERNRRFFKRKPRDLSK
ncbi:MAG: hypothetical protein NTY90_04585 [Candidatus Micrarchaeota archaeon]|nr:hypothetical protein [Candidatus Micrarchaeota archaeon]